MTGSNSIKRLELKELLNGLLFASPWIIGFCVFGLYPIGTAFYYSFCNVNLMGPSEWIGLSNYKEMFFVDEKFWISLYNTIYYIIIALPLQTILALGIALLLNTSIKYRSTFRTIFFLPSIVPQVASAIMWIWILNPRYGLVNTILRFFGFEGLPWLSSPEWAKPALILMGLWGIGYPIVIYLAGLQDVPIQLYEAAELDGASSFDKFRFVTLPFLSPVILFNVIMGLIGAFQYFTQAYLMTGGGPMNSTLFYALYLYQNAFEMLKMGYASGMAVILLFITLISTLLVFRSSARLVYYQE
jgi:multiple sugar transport system permease protein